MLPRLITICLLLLLSSPAAAEIKHTWEEAQRAAAENGQLLVVDFYADWCGPCKRFDAAMLENEDLEAVLEGVVFFQIDAEKEGRELAERHKISGFPTYVVFDPRGEVLGRWWGYEDPAQWVASFQEIASDPSTMEQKLARYESAPTAQDARRLARYRHTRAEYVEATQLFEQAIQMDPGREVEDRLEIFEVAVDAHRDEALGFDRLRERADAVIALGDRVAPDAAASMASAMVRAARREENVALSRAYLEATFARLRDGDGTASSRWRERLAVDHALVVEEDAAKAVALQKARYSEGWLQDSNTMNAFAWWCFENRINLEEAERIAREAVDLATTDGDKASVLDTVAEICNARGDCRDALSLAEQALALAPDSEYLQKQVQRFQEVLATAE